MGEISKLRLTCLRERDSEQYDNSVSKLAGEATKVERVLFRPFSKPRA